MATVLGENVSRILYFSLGLTMVIVGILIAGNQIEGMPYTLKIIRIIVGTGSWLIMLMILRIRKSRYGDSNAEKGFKAYAKGKFDIAIQEFKKALEKELKEHEPALIYTALGNTYGDLGNTNEAMMWQKKAIDSNPNSYKAWSNIGVVHYNRGNYREAEKCYKRALRLNPNYAEVHTNMGALYLDQNKPTKAIESFEASKNLDYKLATNRGNLTIAYATAGRFEDADQELKQAMKLGYTDVQDLQDHIERLREHDGYNKKRQQYKTMKKVIISRKAVKKSAGNYWNAFNDFLSMSDLENLSGIIRKCYLVYWYAGAVEDGGHVQYFDNMEVTDFDEVVEALKFLGAQEHATLLTEALSCLPQLLDEDLPEDEYEKLEETGEDLDERFYDLKPELLELLESIQKQHEAEIVQWVD